MTKYDLARDVNLHIAFERSQRALQRSLAILRQTEALCGPEVRRTEADEVTPP
jgi:hypothetical protein